MKTESTWQQGADAYHAGRAPIENPYPYRYDDGSEASMDYHGWLRGFMWARSQSRDSERTNVANSGDAA